MEEGRRVSTLQWALMVSAVVAAGVATALGLVLAPLLGGFFLFTALVTITPLPMRENPKACTRTCFAIGLCLLAWALIGTIIGMFVFLPAALLMLVAPFADRDNRPGAWFTALTPVAVAALVALIVLP
ncbi:hypothetical protein [Streptomyces bambusae]|uniref:DUF4190 domain-containing protein n=1 Tax=Streptomyces bambusae TaxID=1550616 RepID=A0ABS6Z0C1_9ACTN|nr:hypothetical protein [Streptomyces bambusae]MBW5481195.1 hypothetical protein [Streptomyces bambusae]